MDIFIDKLTTNLLQKFLNETEKIHRKLDRLESKIQEQKMQFGKTFSSLCVQLAPILGDTERLKNGQNIQSQNDSKMGRH